MTTLRNQTEHHQIVGQPDFLKLLLVTLLLLYRSIWRLSQRAAVHHMFNQGFVKQLSLRVQQSVQGLGRTGCGSIRKGDTQKHCLDFVWLNHCN